MSSKVSSPAAAPTSSSELAAREVGPVARARDVCAPGGAAVQAVRTVVALIAAAASSRLDLRALAPFVVARDRDDVRAGGISRAPHRVVGRALEPRLDPQVAGSRSGLVARTYRGPAEDAERTCLPAKASELRAVVEQDVVRVEAGEAGSRGKPDAVRLRQQSHAVRLPRNRPPRIRLEVVRTIDVDV